MDELNALYDDIGAALDMGREALADLMLNPL